jgi:hypothetical protein
MVYASLWSFSQRHKTQRKGKKEWARGYIYIWPGSRCSASIDRCFDAHISSVLLSIDRCPYRLCKSSVVMREVHSSAESLSAVDA